MGNKTPLSIAALLTWTAGFVDAVGFLCLGHIYTANMSGNSVAIGIQAVAQNWPEMLRRICPVAAYFVGLVFCRSLIEIAARERFRSIASVAFACEIVLLVPLCLTHSLPKEFSPMAFGYIALLAAGMGVQNAALTHFSSLTVHTGFVTGTLVKAAEELTKYLTLAFDRLRAPGASLGNVLADSFREKPFRLSNWLLRIWTTYVVGAACGAWTQHRFSSRALTVPIACLAALFFLGLRRPLATAEKAEQSKLES